MILGVDIAVLVASLNAPTKPFQHICPARRHGGRQLRVVRGFRGNRPIIPAGTRHVRPCRHPGNTPASLVPTAWDEHGPETSTESSPSPHAPSTLDKHASPLKKPGYGRIINTVFKCLNSPTGLVGYAAAKVGHQLTWALAFELGPYGITSMPSRPLGRHAQMGLEWRAEEKVRRRAGVDPGTAQQDPRTWMPIIRLPRAVSPDP